MVRLEITIYNHLTIQLSGFTFQYGQIRNFEYIDHLALVVEFTFQYGQIRNIVLPTAYNCI